MIQKRFLTQNVFGALTGALALSRTVFLAMDLQRL